MNGRTGWGVGGDNRLGRTGCRVDGRAGGEWIAQKKREEESSK